MKKRQFTMLVLGLVLCSLPACDVFESDDEVVVRHSGEEIVVVNFSASPIYTAAFERDALARSLWIPCRNPDRCEGLSYGKARTIILEEVSDYEEGDEVVVYWWYLREKEGVEEYEVVDLTSTIIDT